MIETYKAIHCGTKAGQVVSLDGTAVVCRSEIVDPFVVNG